MSKNKILSVILLIEMIILILVIYLLQTDIQSDEILNFQRISPNGKYKIFISESKLKYPLGRTKVEITAITTDEYNSQKKQSLWFLGNQSTRLKEGNFVFNWFDGGVKIDIINAQAKKRRFRIYWQDFTINN